MISKPNYLIQVEILIQVLVLKFIKIEPYSSLQSESGMLYPKKKQSEKHDTYRTLSTPHFGS